MKKAMSLLLSLGMFAALLAPCALAEEVTTENAEVAVLAAQSEVAPEADAVEPSATVPVNPDVETGIEPEQVESEAETPDEEGETEAETSAEIISEDVVAAAPDFDYTVCTDYATGANYVGIIGMKNPNYSTDIHLVIPSTIEGYPVWHVSGFSGNTNIKSLELSEGIKTVGGFTDCTNLTSLVNIPRSLESVSHRAFDNTGLTALTISDEGKELEI